MQIPQTHWGLIVHHFRSATLAAVAVFGLASIASAADMPAKAPVYKAVVAASTPWTGFYVNGGVGYGMWTADTTTVNTFTGLCLLCETHVIGGKGWLATIGIGYDYQFTSKIVAGVFGDASLSALKGVIQDRALVLQGDIKQTSSWAFGARAGWLVTPQTLSYLNGGYASARFSGTNLVSQVDGSPTAFSTQAFTATGWFLGGGVETTLLPGWFWRNEYRYAYYGNKSVAELPSSFYVNFKPTVQTVTTQLVYKFNAGLPAPMYPATAAMPTNWSGFYVNGGVGYGMWNADSTLGVPGAGCVLCATRVEGGKGYLGRVGIGYDRQFTPAWVAGVFGDFDISSLRGSMTNQESVFQLIGTVKQASAWAVGPRLGWLPSPQTMAYVNGGYTGARFSGVDLGSTTGGGSSGFSTPAFTTNGWFAGGGVETTFDLFGKGWFWRNEYRYASYGNTTLAPSPVPVVNFNVTFKPTVQTVTSEILFKFN